MEVPRPSEVCDPLKPQDSLKHLTPACSAPVRPSSSPCAPAPPPASQLLPLRPAAPPCPARRTGRCALGAGRCPCRWRITWFLEAWRLEQVWVRRSPKRTRRGVRVRGRRASPAVRSGPGLRGRVPGVPELGARSPRHPRRARQTLLKAPLSPLKCSPSEQRRED